MEVQSDKGQMVGGLQRGDELERRAKREGGEREEEVVGKRRVGQIEAKGSTDGESRDERPESET